MAADDPQKKILYAWEDRVIGPRDRTLIPYARAQMQVDAVWMAAGLLYAPVVHPLHPNTRRYVGKAHRSKVWLPEKRPTPSWIILHEVAHSMTATMEGEIDGHGPKYLWVYMTLVERHLKIPMLTLMATAKQAGLEFEIGARPMVLDPA